ncbi:MAG: FmdB family zinc ribbon protein [Nocardioidaceae bacterium]
MPTYQYLCTECGEPLEVQQSFSESSLTECPSCTGRLRKVFNAVGVVFKGSGFYRNDSRGADPATTSADSSGDKANASGGGDAGKSDAGRSDTSDGGAKKADSTPAKSSSESKAKATTPA